MVVSGRWIAPAYEQVEADKDVTLDFAVKPGHGLKGRIEDEDGNPVAHAYVSGSMLVKRTGSTRDDVYFLTDIYTDKDGSFRLDHLPEHEVYADVYADGYDSLDNERLKVDKDDYTLVLHKTVPGQVCGTVVRDSDGTPVTDFNVRLDFSRAGGRSGGITCGLVEQGVNFTAADGRFAIADLKVGEGFRIVVTAAGLYGGIRGPGDGEAGLGGRLQGGGDPPEAVASVRGQYHGGGHRRAYRRCAGHGLELARHIEAATTGT